MHVLKYGVLTENFKSIARSTDQQVIAFGKIVRYSQSPSGGSRHATGGLGGLREAPGWVRRQRGRRSCGQEALLGFQQKGTGNVG